MEQDPQTEALRRFLVRCARTPLGLPPSSFVAVHARRLRDAKLVWANVPFLRELGVAVPATGLTAEMERVLLDELAYRVPRAEDPPALFEGPSRIFWADRYGAEGVGNNLGSGRAATRGLLQLKGIGVTPLVGKRASETHRNGALSLRHAMREAVWTELNHLEAPHGANRVLAIIDTVMGTPRFALLARLFPLRPAHFIMNWATQPDATAFRATQRCLPAALPSGARDPQRRLREGFFTLAERLGEQGAALFVRRIPHGAMTASNVQTDGRLLDCESQAARPGHAPTLAIRTPLHRSDASGPAEETMRVLGFCAGLGLPPRLASAIPPQAKLVDRAQRAHVYTVLHELVHLCGFPAFVLAASPPDDRFGRLALALQRVACEEREPILIERADPRWTGEYDVGAIVYALACLYPHGQRRARTVLVGAKKDERLTPLVDAYFALRAELAARARSIPMSPDDLSRLVIKLARVRNQPRPRLFHRRTARENAVAANAYVASGDPRTLVHRIDGLIADNRRFFVDEPAGCVIRAWDDRLSGATAVYEYVAQRGYEFELTAPTDGQTVWAFGRRANIDNEINVNCITKGATKNASIQLRWSRDRDRVRLQLALSAEADEITIYFRSTRGLSLRLLSSRWPGALLRISKGRTISESHYRTSSSC